MKSIKKLFVPYEIAMLLKEKGFDEPCFGYFPNVENSDKNRIHMDHDPEYAKNSMLRGSAFSAPTYDQALDWFRERWIWVSVNLFYYDGVHYLPNIASANPLIELDGGDDYYECMNRAIIKAIELIK